jgi:cytidine deaminase
MLTPDDLGLIAAARAVLEQQYKPFWHTVSAALRMSDGRIVTGIHLGAAVGRLAVCAEAVALGRAILDGGGSVVTAVAVRHPKPDEDDRDLAVVSPCGACREMFTDHAPGAMVIVPGRSGPEKVSVQDLLPLPYRR